MSLHPRAHARRLPLVLAAGLACAASLAATSVLADEVSGLRSEKLRETAHHIELRLGRGSAELVVKRTVFNGGTRHDQATFMLETPGGAVATGLRTLGYLDGEPRWFDGELMEAEAAAAKYRELTGIGGYYPKDPALLSWRSRDLLALQVFPCAPAQPKTVEYTLRMPTAYEGGKHHLVLPRMGTEKLPAEAVITAAIAGDALSVDGKPAAPGTSVRLAAESTDIAVQPSGVAELEGALASVTFGDDRTLVQVHVEAAPRLSELPRRPWVVVAIDTSRSIGERDGAAGVAAARAYLSHLGDAQVQVLTFDREVVAREGRGFVSSARARADLDALTITRRNGSRIDDALARADALLARAPKGSPRRILAVTDLLARSSLTPERVAGIVKSGALVHVGVVEEGDPRLDRDDDHVWAAPVRATGGLVWRGAATLGPDQGPEIARVFEEWARPTRIQKLEVEAKGLDGDPFGQAELREGQGLEHHTLHTERVREVSIRGELWARPVRKVFTPDDAHGRLWSALVFGSDLVGLLDEPEMMWLAMRGRAVSPVTSYLAIEPGVRPSTEGLEEGGGGRGEGIGLGSVGTFGRGSGAGPGFDPQRYLERALEPELARCAPSAKSGRVVLETTTREVVDVPAVSIDGADAAARACLEEAAWDLQLPLAFARPFVRFTVDLDRRS